MARDLRIYKYSNGTLQKISRSIHRQYSIRACKNAIALDKINRSKSQYLIVEYIKSYESEIIYISPLDLAKTI